MLDAPRSGRPPTALGIIDPLIEAVIEADPRDYGYHATGWTAPLLQRYLEEVHSWGLASFFADSGGNPDLFLGGTGMASEKVRLRP